MVNTSNISQFSMHATNSTVETVVNSRETTTAICSNPISNRVDQAFGLLQQQESLRRQLFRRAKRIRDRRAGETAEGRTKRLQQDAQRRREYRKRQTQEQKENCRVQGYQRQQKHRQQRSVSRLGEETNEGVVNNYLGKMIYPCLHCDALHSKNEVASGKKDEYRQCCHYGSVALPALLPYPEELKILLKETNREGKNFRENIRSFNNAVAFASMGANIVSPTSNRPYCFRIHGQIYHRIGSLHAEAGKNAHYAQLYILD